MLGRSHLENSINGIAVLLSNSTTCHVAIAVVAIDAMIVERACINTRCESLGTEWTC